MTKRANQRDGVPLLTIAVPAYNVEKYLDTCIESLVDTPRHEIEVIIVDDGSSDETKKRATVFTDKYPYIKLISKKNGGHGSTINVALESARGKYFKILDGDDFFYSKALLELLQALKDSKADIILTDYTEYYMESGEQRPINDNYTAMKGGEIYSLESSQVYNQTLLGPKGPLLATTTFRTDLFKQSPFYIDEKCYYVDMEYNFFVFQRAKTIMYIPINLYGYRLEREGQSMQRSSLIRNHKDHGRVCVRLSQELSGMTDTSASKRTHLLNSIVAPMCARHYEILTSFLRKRKPFYEFDSQLKQYPEIYESSVVSGKIINIHRRSRGLTVFADVLLHKVGDLLKRFERK